MKYLRFIGLLPLIMILSAAALAQGRPQQPGFGFGLGSSGSIVVYVRQSSGQMFRTMPQVSLESSRNPLVISTPGPYGSGVIFQGVPLGGYTVVARYPGFKPGSSDVELDISGETQTVVIILQPEGDNSEKVAPAVDGAMISPKVQKEIQKALKEITSKHKDFVAGRKHLEKALREAPNSYQVNYLIGMTYIWSDQWKDGKPYLERAKALNPKYLPTLKALASTCSELGDYAGSIESAGAAVKLEPSDWKAQWILSDAYLRSGQFDQARAHAGMAVETSKGQAGGAQIILGEALAALGRREEAATALESYLKQHRDAPNAEVVRQFISSLRQPPRVDQPAKSVVSTAENASTPPNPPISKMPAPAADTESVKVPWAPLDVDAVHPAVDPTVACSLPNVLRLAGKKSQRLVHDLQEFLATEDYQSVVTGRGGNWGNPVSAEFDYMVLLNRQGPSLLDVQEVRQPIHPALHSMGDFEDQGTSALALIFHPYYQGDFDMKCEGLGYWGHQPAWIVHFVQRVDRPRRIRGFQRNGTDYPLSLKGRAWIATASHEILHLETDLAQPVPAIGLKKEHISVDYQPVLFAARKTKLWLPQNVDVYIDYRGRYIHQYHHYRNFRLFWVGSKQTIEKPQSN